MDKNLLKNLKQAYRSVINETVEDLDIEETMKELDTNGFSEKVSVDDMPSGIRGLLKFPYIPNVNVIDSMKYNKEKQQVLLQFKLNFKKLSDIFITKANQEHLIGNATNKNADRIVSFGLNNLRMIVVFQLAKPLADGREPVVPEDETPTEPTEKITEGKNFYEKEDDNYTAFDVDSEFDDLRDIVIDLNRGKASQALIKDRLRAKIESYHLKPTQKQSIFYRAGGNNSDVNNNPTTDDLADRIFAYVAETELNESEGSSAVFAFKDNMSSLAAVIQNITTDYSLDDDDKKEIKKTWGETLKVIEKMFKENKLNESNSGLSTIQRIKTIPEDVNLVEYIKSKLFTKNGEYYYDDDYGVANKINFGFQGDDTLVYPDGKYKLLPDKSLSAGGLFFDLRYPNKISKMAEWTNPSPIKFGYQRYVNTKNGTYLDANDAFIPVEKITKTISNSK